MYGINYRTGSLDWSYNVVSGERSSVPFIPSLIDYTSSSPWNGLKVKRLVMNDCQMGRRVYIDYHKVLIRNASETLAVG